MPLWGACHAILSLNGNPMPRRSLKGSRSQSLRLSLSLVMMLMLAARFWLIPLLRGSRRSREPNCRRTPETTMPRRPQRSPIGGDAGAAPPARSVDAAVAARDGSGAGPVRQPLSGARAVVWAEPLVEAIGRGRSRNRTRSPSPVRSQLSRISEEQGALAMPSSSSPHAILAKPPPEVVAHSEPTVVEPPPLVVPASPPIPPRIAKGRPHATRALSSRVPGTPSIPPELTSGPKSTLSRITRHYPSPGLTGSTTRL